MWWCRLDDGARWWDEGSVLPGTEGAGMYCSCLRCLPGLTSTGLGPPLDIRPPPPPLPTPPPPNSRRDKRFQEPTVLPDHIHTPDVTPITSVMKYLSMSMVYTGLVSGSGSEHGHARWATRSGMYRAS